MGLRYADTATAAYHYPLTIRHLLHTPLAAARHQEIVYRDQLRLTYDEFSRRLHRLANALAMLGVGEGVTVAVLDWDSHRYLECYFAVPMMGAVLQTVNVRLAPDQIRYTIDHAGAEVLLVHRDFVGLVAEMHAHLPKVRHLVFIDDDNGDPLPPGYTMDYEAALEGADDMFAFQDFDENAIATTFYTTGTTGLPKAVSFSHRQIVLHTLATLGTLALQAPEGMRLGDVYMPLTPMFHVHAWGMPYVATLIGVKQVYPGRYAPDVLLDLRAREGVTYSHCVPTILQMLLDAADTRGDDLSGWVITIGGAAFTQAQCAAARIRGLTVMAGYGMSETGPTLTLTRSRHDPPENTEDARVATFCKTGLPALLVDLRVVDEQMRDLPHDGVSQGEIVVRAPWLTTGYAGDLAASETLWHGGWLHTQDVATIDADGYVQIRDRLKDVIKTGGEWISSLMLEDLILSHPGVSEVAVVGVPDTRWDERPVAFVVTADQQKSIDLGAVRAHLQPAISAGTISRYAVPDRLVITEALPRTSVGKIDKKRLRALLTEQGNPDTQRRSPGVARRRGT